MSILVTFEKREYYCTEEQAAAIWAAKEKGEPVTLTNPKTGAVIVRLAPGAIATIRPGGDNPYIDRLPAPERPQLTEEQLAARREKIAEAKRDFMARMEAKGK